ncbi:MAG: hypothetical protein QNK36_14135 [Colwellia sp.]|nr:hypothetical protein [Colwellia sp.]
MKKLYLDKKRDLTKLKSQSITLFPSKKMSSTVFTECPLEANFCYYLEFDDEIDRYESQPLGYYFQFKNDTHVFTPDFEVFSKNKSFYYEVQSKIQAANQSDFLGYFNAARAQAKRLNKDLFLVKECWIRRSPHFQNLMQLYRCIQVEYSHDFLLRIKDKLTFNKILTISELIELHSELACVYRLIAEKVLTLEFPNECLGVNSRVLWSNDE